MHQRGGGCIQPYPSPISPRFLPELLEKSIITSSTTTPSNTENPISGVRAAKVTPSGVVLELLLLSWLMLLLLLLKSSDVLGKAASALAGERIRGMVDVMVLCVCKLWWEGGHGRVWIEIGCEKSRGMGWGGYHCICRFCA